MTLTEKRLKSLLGRTEALYTAVFETNPFSNRNIALSALSDVLDVLKNTLEIERAQPAARRK